MPSRFLVDAQVQYPSSKANATAAEKLAENDDYWRAQFCAVGQTLAAHELCRNLRPYMKRHHVQTGVGHYGVFNGQRWRD